jgi:hypothetical protein
MKQELFTISRVENDLYTEECSSAIKDYINLNLSNANNLILILAELTSKVIEIRDSKAVTQKQSRSKIPDAIAAPIFHFDELSGEIQLETGENKTPPESKL